MWEKKPVLLLILATAAILVGTIVTMVLPFAWVNTESDRIASVKPYTPLELTGRDIYIREGCNNCHTQTVRPLVAEVLRYGDYSKSGEFVYDRPHLWGSRRTGPDLARVGGKYPDDWHYQHLDNPAGMIRHSNMPAYTFLRRNQLDPALAEKKMKVLGWPYAKEQIAALKGRTEMDAMVAYLQKLGSGIPWREAGKIELAGATTNPFAGDKAAIAAGKQLYLDNCAACHGENLGGGIGPDLTQAGDMDEADLLSLLNNGRPEGGMPGYAAIGQARIWKIVNFLKAGKAS